MCKMEGFGNCDQDTKNNECCIFHKPNKTIEEVREFYEKLKLRLLEKKDKLDFRGYVFPKPEYGKVIDFKFLLPNLDEIALSFYCDNAIFEANVDFSHIRFKKEVSFYKTTFKGIANFEFTEFEKHLNLSKAVFKGLS